jgi:hypothetical protein
MSTALSAAMVILTDVAHHADDREQLAFCTWNPDTLLFLNIGNENRTVKVQRRDAVWKEGTPNPTPVRTATPTRLSASHGRTFNAMSTASAPSDDFLANDTRPRPRPPAPPRR